MQRFRLMLKIVTAGVIGGIMGMAIIAIAELQLPEGTMQETSTGVTSLSGLTTNLAVLVPGGGTNTFVITNGVVVAIN